MAKQIAGLCHFVGTIDDMTFYKMEGKYYARAKSSLTGKRVKTSPAFRRTMINAGLLARASKIGRVIYKALPPRWRQYWMYRSFTGEALLLLKHNPYTEQQVTQMLWDCYVKYWEERKAADPDNPLFQPVPVKIRKRRKYSEESLERLRKRRGWKKCEATPANKSIVEVSKEIAIQEPGNNSQLPTVDQTAPVSESNQTGTVPIPTASNKQSTIPPVLSTWHVLPTGQLIHPFHPANPFNSPTLSICQPTNNTS